MVRAGAGKVLFLYDSEVMMMIRLDERSLREARVIGSDAGNKKWIKNEFVTGSQTGTRIICTL